MDHSTWGSGFNFLRGGELYLSIFSTNTVKYPIVYEAMGSIHYMFIYHTAHTVPAKPYKIGLQASISCFYVSQLIFFLSDLFLLTK